jgi:DNA primase
VSIFETLRERIDLPSLAGRFTDLKPSGDKMCGCCPFPHHRDDTPSFYCYPDSRYHCFGCGAHGDVADLWAGARGLEPGIEAALELAREYGLTLPDGDTQARRKAQERREQEDNYLEQARACHETLTLHPEVARWWERRGFGEELRERFLLGATEDGTAAIIPFWHRGRVHGLIRRQLSGKPPKYLYPKAEDFPGGRKPLFIPGPIRAGALLVEGIVDGLASATLGESVVAVGGTAISLEQMRELESATGPIYVLPDDDEEGDKAGREWVHRLYPKALLCPAEYGEGRKDLADLVSAGEDAAQVLEGLKARAVDALGLELSEASGDGDTLRAYRVAKERILPLLLKLEEEGERDAALHDVAGRLKLSIKPLRKALAAMLEQQREKREEEAEEADAAAPEPGTKRYERAMELLKDRRLLSRAAVDMKRLGHVGEFAAKKLTFICGVSARSGKPIQPSTHAQSAAGKNSIWDTALSLFPPEMVVKRSGLSAKALFRTQANLKGAVLYIQEVTGSEGAEYTIRVMQSDGRLEYEATEKMPDGSLRNVVYQTEGPTVVVQTTTKNHLHPENETRVFPIYIDESEEQTSRIVESILREASGRCVSPRERERIREKWHDAIRLLEPAEVVIPYAERIEIPSSPLRIRRDARRLIDVVRVIAWLHQHQRERDEHGRILASEGDFDEALRLVSESLRRAWQTLTPAEEKVLGTIRELPEQPRSEGFKRRDLKVEGVSDRRVKEALKSLADTGYLDCDGRAGPQGYTFTLAREAEKISLGIYLRPSPDSKGIPPNAGDPTGRGASARCRPVPDSEDEGDSGGLSGDAGRNGHRPIKSDALQEKHSIGHTGGGRLSEKVETATKQPWRPGRPLTDGEVQEVRRLMRNDGLDATEARRVVLERGGLLLEVAGKSENGQ